MFSLEGKTAMVIGGAGGIGHAIAKGLAAAGAKVAIASRGEEKLKKACDAIKEETGCEAKYYVCDVTDEAAVEKLAADFKADFGKVDILVNSQGYNKKSTVFEQDMDEWDRHFLINVKGMLMCCKHFGRYMKEQGKGRIINVSSIGAVRSKKDDISTAYGSSKGAVNGMILNLAAGWAGFGITVNGIAPIICETEMMKPILEANPMIKTSTEARVPCGRLCLPEDCIAPVVFFASDEAEFVTGQLIYLDGGLLTQQ